MGNTQSTRQTAGFQQLQKQYRDLRKQKNGVVLLHTGTCETYFMRELSFINKKQFDSEVVRIQQGMKNQSNENIIKVVKVWHKEFSNFCSNSFKIFTVYEYPEITLLDEIEARKKENRSFQQCDLWSILQSCTNALAQLKHTISIEPSKIFILPDGLLKLPHNDMVDDEYRCIIHENTYYAPEKINCFNKPDKPNGLQKQSVFSMGMTILHAASLQDLHFCYDYKNSRFLEENLESILTKAEEKYSKEFIEVISNILQMNSNRRPSLIQLQDILNSKWQENPSESPKEQNDTETMKITQDISPNSHSHEQDPYTLQQITDKLINQKQNQQKPTHNQSINAQQKTYNQARKSLLNLNINSYPTYDNRLSYQPYQRTYQPTFQSKQNIFTDPKLLEMIRKDLIQISQIKRSVPFYQNLCSNYQTRPTYTVLNNLPSIFQSSNLNQDSINFRISNNQVKQEPTPVISVVTDSDGTIYEGTITNGKKEGEGKLSYPGEAFYEGQFINDMMNGKGTLYYRKGRPVYEGQWINNQFDGKGILYNQDPHPLQCEFDFQNLDEAEEYWVKYDGQFRFDNKNGRGKLTLSNGQVFEGTYLNDMANGPGQFKNRRGQIVKGIWENNQLVSILNDQKFK